VASAAADISDGLVGDLGHILERSGVGAQLVADDAVRRIAAPTHAAWASARVDAKTLRLCALSGGDDYELVFTAPPAAREAVEAAGRASATPVARIGRIEAQAGLRVIDAQGAPIAEHLRSFDHFG
jgi:thiamine-monophosphate kinase